MAASAHTYPQSQSDSPEIFCDIEVSIGSSLATFNLENAVCSHGLFMMAPNKWDPFTKSLIRPLRLSDCRASALVRVFKLPHALLMRVYGTRYLAHSDKDALTTQVRRMLRLSEGEETKMLEFQEMHAGAKAKGFGRVFRSPTLFEDMVKCILFCNCQWPRSLSMAQALCDLQLELQCQSSKVSLNAVDRVKSQVAADGPVSLAPSTPAVKESKRKREPQKRAEVVAGQNAGNADDSNVDLNVCVRFLEMANATQLSGTTLVSSVNHENIGNPMSHYPSLYEDSKAYCNNIMGDFPSPKEIARLDEKYLAKRCCLGYRARRILKLAQAVDDGSIKLSKLEELCSEASLTNCNKVDGMLKEINGFGPFTRGNVLMCMGFYNVVPTDSETIRHLKQVHARATTIGTVKEVVEEIYGHYEPYQFLAYWSELWSFYEGWFGKLSEMSSSDYRLITASNMKTQRKYIK